MGEAASGTLAEALINVTAPDLVLLDLHESGERGVLAAGRIHERFPRVGLMALGTAEDRRLLEQAARIGAQSYVLNRWEPDDLLQAIHLALAGRQPQPTGNGSQPPRY